MVRVLLFLVPVVLSWLIVYSIRQWAEHRQILDIPNQRSSHLQPTPRGGGLAIVVVSLLGWLAFGLHNPAESRLMLLTYACGAALIAAVSWVDDLHSLSNRVRFATHSLGALLAIWGCWHSAVLPASTQLHLGWLGVPLCFLWIVGLTNAYNFMDGLDGLAGSQAVVAGLGWAVLGWLMGEPLLCVMGLLLVSCSLGFLGHNWPPARIFMGDVGSAFLGYTFAVLAVIAVRVEVRLALAGVLLVWPFLFDTVFTFLCRLRRGENVFAAHRCHLFQRLVIAGHTHRFVTLLYSGLALCGATLSVAWVTGIHGSALAIVVLLPLLGFVLWLYVIRLERRHAIQASPSMAAAGR